MKKLITDGLGGHPVKYKDFEFIQEMIAEVVRGLSSDIPLNKVVVLKGCDIATDGSDLTVTEGYALYNNEVFYVPHMNVENPMPGLFAQWYIKESNDSRGEKTFASGAIRQVFKKRELEVRFDNEFAPGIATIEETEPVLRYSGAVPIGGIIQWSGINIPKGWALCDGSIVNGYKTPDLKGRMTIAYDSNDVEYNSPGNLSEKGSDVGKTGNGGGKKATFTTADMPKHRHAKGTLSASSTNSTHYHGIGVKYGQVDRTDQQEVVDHLITDGNQVASEGAIVSTTLRTNTTTTNMGAHSHVVTGDTADAGGASTSIEKDVRHPWYVLAFIMRVG